MKNSWAMLAVAAMALVGCAKPGKAEFDAQKRRLLGDH